MAPWFLRACALVFVLAAVPAHPMQAQNEKAYVGVWALQLDDCGAAPGDPSPPLEIAVDYYDRGDTHCAFTTIEEKGVSYDISADCTVAGKPQARTFTLTVAAETLTFADTSGQRQFARCK